MQKKPSFFRTGKGLALLGFILVSLIGIPAAIYLVQRQQIIQQEASCINNDIIWCGVTSAATDVAKAKADVINAMKNGDSHGRKDIAAILNAFGITEDGINSSDTVRGLVYKENGRITIFVGSTEQTVATGATSAGRDFYAGSQRCTQYPQIWCRPPSVTFTTPTGNALVHVENGVFKWAVLTGCGNPVIGTPNETPTPTPTPTIPGDTPTPTPTIPGDTPTPTVTPTNGPSSTPTPTSEITPTPTLPGDTPTPPRSTNTPPPPTNTVTVPPTIPPSGPGDTFVGIGIVGMALTVIGGLIFILL